MRQAADRRDGVHRALEHAGLELRETLVEVEALSGGTSFTTDAGAAGTASLLDGDAAPTALLCANDQMALGAMRELRRRGLSVPEDVAVVGYDDISIAGELSTPLTSVHRPKREMGAAAAELLLDDGAVRHVTFTPELVVRASTTP
ncbi:substrate-binding domain-containing protein [Actinomyces slackii]|uniref:HTH-type transcriptional repressor CytR n=1 Tax=Actinomyces slackii TaxID=52774 RepID=A0A3S4SDS8_9ACTO|nr:HTH-type transcriptional repressor CytR [Actinomyces slackii]